MDIIARNRLEGLSIYELRAVARQVGVKSPTTKKHRELVEAVLRIQSGEERAFSTNKGRPPKQLNLVSQPFDLNRTDESIPEYDYADDLNRNPYLLCDLENIDGLNGPAYDVRGIVRQYNGKKYIYGYDGQKRFTFLESEATLNCPIHVGDFIMGKALDLSQGVGILREVQEVNFNSQPIYQGGNEYNISLREFRSPKEIYSDILQDDNKVKILLEIETSENSLLEMYNKCVYVYSTEHEDVKRSYNTVLDALKLIKMLKNDKKQFSFYLSDIDYVYTVLNSYLTDGNARPEIDACQLIRELIVNVKNADGGDLYVYEKPNYKRDSYLSAIINKYLS